MILPKTIKETKERLIRKEFSCVQLVDSYLSNINSKNKELNAVLTISDEIAYRDAKKADEIIKNLGEEAFNEFPLLGVTVIHKDIFLTKGVRTTAASKLLENYVPVYSATVVNKLEKAGCIMLGKANCDAWAHGSSGENSDFGPTKNPHNQKYVPGGSSSGSASAVAANFSLISTATDTCGSTRLPANFCGLVGLKPTYGAVSRYGCIAMASSLDSMGHITSSVEDSRKIFNVTKGPDGFDATVARHSGIPVKDKLTIGVPNEFFVNGLDKEIVKNINEVKTKYESLGVKFKEISLPHTKYAISAYYIIQPAEVSSNLGRYDGIRFGDSRNKFGDEAKRRIMLGTYVLSAGYYDAYYLKAMKARTIISKEVYKTFDEVDAIIAPVSPTLPFKLGEKVSDPLKMYLTDIFAATANLSGIPSIAIPSGFAKNKLPLGFQLMGPRFGEDILFKLGEMYERN